MATRGREFPNSKRADRNASEPPRSLVNELEEPTLWSEGEGRWMDAEITEVASIDFRDSRAKECAEARSASLVWTDANDAPPIVGTSYASGQGIH